MGSIESRDAAAAAADGDKVEVSPAVKKIETRLNLFG